MVKVIERPVFVFSVTVFMVSFPCSLLVVVFLITSMLRYIV